METQSVLLLLLCAVSTCWGQQVVCLFLPTPTNGVIFYSDTILGDGTVATYTCDTGYTLNGGSTRTCGSNGMWSGFAPSCQPNCPELPTLANGMIMYSAGSTHSRPISSSATHSCNTGYTLTGDATRICVSGVWSGSPPVCQLNTGPTEPPTTCPYLTVPANGRINYNMGTASPKPVDTVATYTCNTGYTLDEGTTRTCGSDGVWSGSAPTCRRK
ncbi:E-selectin-like [Halichondria panicea]|uniref:E-selectin-like n=1 Tax=Halichondria panicea TaxID=6063 RepID=UPI00312B94B1